MKRHFVRSLLVFCIPVLLYATASAGLVAYSGEWMPLREVVALQMGNTPILYGRAYRVNYFAYKLIATQLRKPKVLILGSSHVMFFRSEFFNKDTTVFYNGGGAIHNLSEIKEYLSYLDASQTPDVVMLGLDQAWFNAAGAAGFSDRQVGDPIDDESWVPTERIMNVSKQAIGDLLNGTIQIGPVLKRTDPVHGTESIGLNAIMNGVGFRNDGSLQSGTAILQHPTVEQMVKTAQNFMASNLDYYARADHVVGSRINEMADLLAYAEAHHIYVIGISPPFAPSVYNLLMQDGGYKYLPEMAAQLKALFERYHFSYFDFTNAASVGATDEQMNDDTHASEYVSLEMYVQMLEATPDVLGKYSDPAYLHGVLAQPDRNPFDLFASTTSR